MPHSKITTICFFLLLNLATFRFSGVASQPQVPCFFIFGDSLVDAGNNNYLSTATKVDYLPYGIDFPAGPTGRYTNGRNVVYIITQMLGLDDFIPPSANATDQDILRGLNYGSGGAAILDNSGSGLDGVINMNQQLSNHEAAISKLTALLGSKKEAKKHLNSCLYYVGMGNNDYLRDYLPKYYASAANYTPNQFAALAIKQFSKQLKRLYYNGARKVVVVAVGKVGCVPQQVFTYPVSEPTGCVETSNEVARIFNEKLRLLVAGLNRLPAAKFIYTTDIDETHGNITVMVEPCCPVSAERQGQCVVGGIPCSNRDDYYFWDYFHPTEAANLLSANIVYDAISPLLTKGVDVS
ncbi:GDSL esterase/lipase At1g33811-like [Salvia miltiorrhiza]|uniref:GDSL esterase/lipase At1g33811-like n=1 Tax=Salvia miltiorrhiza TaxID=226208 RepID=UPI0025ACF3BC|nr:GDSL esterase/lipase At1g33811-like [Salvia miltiorrhiza]